MDYRYNGALHFTFAAEDENQKFHVLDKSHNFIFF